MPSQVGPGGNNSNGAGGGITNDAPVRTLPITGTASGDLTASQISDDGVSPIRITAGILIDGAGKDHALLTVIGDDTQGAALIVIRSSNNSAYFVIDPVNGGPADCQLSANPAAGKSALNVGPTAITIKDENGHVLLDIEGGYISLGAGGEIAVGPNGEVFMTLPTSDPTEAGQLWSNLGAVQVSAG